MVIKKVFILCILVLFFSVTISAEKIVILAMDDFQVWWLEDVQQYIVNKHIDNKIPVTLGVIPSGLLDPWGSGDRLKQRIQTWYASPIVEVAQHGYDHEVILSNYNYNSQYNRIKDGKDLMNNVGVYPKSFIPPFGEANDNTILVLDNLGFHTFYDPIDLQLSSSKDVLIIKNQLQLCKNYNEGSSCVFKDYNALANEIENKLNQQEVALVLYHMQDFSTSTGGINTNKANQLVDYANRLKQDGYTLMTIQQYYDHINSGPIICTQEVCDRIDNDCDGQIDEGCIVCVDNDGDGYGLNCEPGPDCNDNNAQVNPGETEICENNLDDDCDNYVDLNDLDCQLFCMSFLEQYIKSLS